MIEDKENEYIDTFISRTLKEYLILCNRSDYKILDVSKLVELLTDFLGIDLK